MNLRRLAVSAVVIIVFLCLFLLISSITFFDSLVKLNEIPVKYALFFSAESAHIAADSIENTFQKLSKPGFKYNAASATFHQCPYFEIVSNCNSNTSSTTIPTPAVFTLHALVEMSRAVKPDLVIVSFSTGCAASIIKQFIYSFFSHFITEDLIIFLTFPGEEISSLFLTPDMKSFFIENSLQDFDLNVSFINRVKVYSMNEKSEQFGLKINFLKLRQFILARRLYFIYPGYNFNRTRFEFYRAESEEYLVLAQSDSIPTLSEMELLKTRVQLFNMSAEQEILEDRLVRGKLNLKNPFKNVFSREFKQFDKWQNSYGNLKLLKKYRSFTSIDSEFFSSFKQVSFFQVNFEGFKSFEVDHGLNDEKSGNLVLTRVFQGYPFQNYMSNESLVFITGVAVRMSTSEFDSYSVVKFRLATLHRSIEQRHLCLSLHKARATMRVLRADDSLSLRSPALDLNYTFYFKTHVTGDRIKRTASVWKSQLSKVGVPFTVTLVTNEPALVSAFSKSGFQLNVVNSSEIPLLIPVEALSLYQEMATKHGGIMFTEKIAGVDVMDLDPLNSKALWLFTQLTWSPVFSEIVLSNKGSVIEGNQFYWFIDYDVAFSGDIANLLKLTDDLKHDFIAGSQILLSYHEYNKIIEREYAETQNTWMWWDWAKISTEYFLNHSDKAQCLSQISNEERVEEYRKLYRRTFASSFRLSLRMIRWIVEAMFVPDKFFWTLDEILYITVCNLHKEQGCSYYPFNSINVHKLDGEPDAPYVNGFDPNFLANIRFHVASNRAELYKKTLADHATFNQIWHSIKTQEVFEQEVWLSENYP